ncbi:Arabinose operon regulatory protein [Paraliobacillus sp. PM-2]|uniref:AraC family transcriptional regulator n=1 Tax=Paraliobacillus sp. PM-2 TaxID=1462524 RepID=UPI00061C0BFB|nr:AraC family transcriptional regulator [Paraliobacillus sp. PM-2]CQR45947.1 Arabinose operon regulatory protein [Paraliobacillus sp. PM-2]
MSDDNFLYKTITHSASETAKKLWFYVHSVGWYICEPTYNITRDHFFGFQIKYVISGKGTVMWRGKTYQVEQGNIFFLDLNQPHSYYADPEDPFKLLWVHFGGVKTEDYFHLLEGNNCPIFQLDESEKVKNNLWNLYHIFKAKQVGHEAVASSIITAMLTDMIVHKMQGGTTNHFLKTPKYPKIVQHAIYYIESEFDKTLTLDQIANEVSLSQFHFTRIFKQATGYSVMEYLQKFRINHAKFLLTNKDMSVGEVSEKCGFSDQSYFGKLFKRYENQTPRQYKRFHERFAPKNIE